MTMMLTTYLASAGIAPFPAGRMRTGTHLGTPSTWSLHYLQIVGFCRSDR